MSYPTKEENRAYGRKYYRKNKKKMDTYAKILAQKPEQRYKRYKYTAGRRGWVFNLSLKRFKKLISKICVYCGENGYGIDRINSDKGYTKENIVPCCTMCNRMKSDYSTKDFITKCKLITNNNELFKQEK